MNNEKKFYALDPLITLNSYFTPTEAP